MTAMKHCRHTPRGEKTRTEDKIELRDFNASDKESGQHYVSFCYPLRNFSKSYLSRELTTSYQSVMEREGFINFYVTPQFHEHFMEPYFHNHSLIPLCLKHDYANDTEYKLVMQVAQNDTSDLSKIRGRRTMRVASVTISAKNSTESTPLVYDKNASTCGPKFSKERLSHYTAYFKNTRNSEDNYELADD